LEIPQSITNSLKKLSGNNIAIVNKTLDKIKAELPDKPQAKLPDDADIDLSDIPEATPEEFERGKAVTDFLYQIFDDLFESFRIIFT